MGPSDSRSMGRLARLSEARPEVSRRWGGYVASRIGRRLGRCIARPKIQWTERKRRRALIGAHEAVLYACRGAERLNLRHSMAVLRVSVYMLTANRDLESVKVDLLTSNDWWLRKYLARNIALLMYETDLRKVAGKDFRRSIDYFAPPKDLRNRLAADLQSVRAAQEQLRSDFAEIRNNTIAHRDADAMNQYRLIRNINEEQVLWGAASYFRAAEPLTRDLIELTEIAGDMGHMINQVAGRKIIRKGKRK